MTFSREELRRYSRQIMIPEIGEKGQQKLRDARVFLGGLGGLGSISAYYLVASGIGSLTIVDMDAVALENLNRQIIHCSTDIGKAKIISAAEKLQALNPHCRIVPVQEEIRYDNAVDLIGDCSVIVDGTDNIETRTVLNRASVERGIPFVFGGVEGFNGMATTFVPGRSPCLECLFPRRTTGRKVPGVLGPLPGLVASIQTLETLKLILKLEGVLSGRVLHVRGKDMTFREIAVGRNPDCEVCHPQ